MKRYQRQGRLAELALCALILLPVGALAGAVYQWLHCDGVMVRAFSPTGWACLELNR